ncbi:TetR/AcrR family transcriptional regulator [Dactylosporangium siamense]|uniref:Transcriptional regulator n=1 Tax=Dactylosporangium siamense TaxID=685454 RepID=A0A919PHT2_9ACTN|nr:TetR/AcrR family transcriptional regulator [Dactylosporangium siamense]GIG42153.1 transcriptional regulator [Dactylosporangium siamense]
MRRAGLTADLVTRAAADLADEVGLAGVTVSAVARHFGVKDASLYSHVRGLSDLRVRIALLAATEFADLLAPAVAGRSGRDALVAFADTYRDYARAHPGRYAAMQQPIDPAVSAPAGSLRGIELIYGMLRGYGLDEPDTTDAVRLLRSTLHGFVDLECRGGFNDPRDTEASWRRVLAALDVLLTHWREALSA